MKPSQNKPPETGAKAPAADAAWRLEDLPPEQQAELRDRHAQAERGEELEDFDEAMADADRMTDEILAVVGQPTQRRSAL